MYCIIFTGWKKEEKRKKKEKVYTYFNRFRRIILQDSKLIIKNFSKVGLEANILNMIKDTFEKKSHLTSNFMVKTYFIPKEMT